MLRKNSYFSSVGQHSCLDPTNAENKTNQLERDSIDQIYSCFHWLTGQITMYFNTGNIKTRWKHKERIK